MKNALLPLLYLVLMPVSAEAHELRPAVLSLSEVGEGRVLGSLVRGTSLTLVFDGACRSHSTAPLALACSGGGLDETTLSVSGFGAVRELVVRIGEETFVLSEDRPSVRLGVTKPSLLAVDYLALGVEHVLTGWDHLAFVLCLLLVAGRRAVLWTVTAFTVAHSLTLALAVTGGVDLPVGPVEAVIALSIVMVAREVLLPSRSLTKRAPYLVAFAFGLIHGFGFAGGLREIGVPESGLLSSLLSFNLGVELGQLAVVGLFLILRPMKIRPILAYATGACAAAVTIQRVLEGVL